MPIWRAGICTTKPWPWVAGWPYWWRRRSPVAAWAEIRIPRPRKQVPLVLNLEIYDLLQALLRERQRQHRQECEKWQGMSGWALRSWQ